jgi:hypothetical protein
VILKRYASIACVAGSVALTLSGSALADSVSTNVTGPESTQSVSLDSSTNVLSANVNSLNVTNANLSQAATGDVTAGNNTSVGDGGSGAAINTGLANTNVVVANSSPTLAQVYTTSSAAPVAVLPGSGSCNCGATTSIPVAGSVLGASTTPGLGGLPAILPVTGASSPIDVSALRAAWHPAISAPIVALTKGSTAFTSAMLLTAAVLSLLGGLGSAWYVRRREERV